MSHPVLSIGIVRPNSSSQSKSPPAPPGHSSTRFCRSFICRLQIARPPATVKNEIERLVTQISRPFSTDVAVVDTDVLSDVVAVVDADVEREDVAVDVAEEVADTLAVDDTEELTDDVGEVVNDDVAVDETELVALIDCVIVMVVDIVVV